MSYAAVYLVWGSTYLFIKIAVETIPPLALVCCRWSIGGIIFLFYYYARHGFTAPSRRELVSAFFMGMLLIFVPNSIVSAAERNIDSYLTALILAAAPIIVAFFDRFLMGKRVSLSVFAGMVTGLAGIAVLVYNGNSIQTSLSNEVFMLFGAVLAFGLGTSIGHRVNSGTSTVVNTGYQMALSGAVAFVWIAVNEPGQLSAMGGFSARSLLALAYLATAGSLAYGAYNYLIKHEPATRITSYALVNPVIAVILGIVIGKESLARYVAIGVPVVIFGLAMMMYGEQFIKYAAEKISSARIAEE